MPISTPSTSLGTATVEVDALVVGAGAAGMTARSAQRGEIHGLYPAPRLSGESPRRHDRRATVGSAAVRRTASRRRLRIGATAHRRIHGTRRHDDWPR